MNDKNIELFIDIHYKGHKTTVHMENIISFEKLLEESMNNFNIKNELKEYIIFTFIDEQGDKCILENDEDIIKNSKEINSEKLLSKLDLEIYQYNKENINNINSEHKNYKIKEINHMYLEENKKLGKQLEEKDNKIKELNDIISNLGKDYTKKLNKIKFLIQKKSEGINNENKNENDDKYRINKSNEKYEKDIIVNKISNLEKQMKNILSQIQQLNEKITKMTITIQKEEKKYEKVDKIATVLAKEEKKNEKMYLTTVLPKEEKKYEKIMNMKTFLSKKEKKYENENNKIKDDINNSNDNNIQREKEEIQENNKIINKNNKNKEFKNKEKETNHKVNDNDEDEDEDEEDEESEESKDMKKDKGMLQQNYHKENENLNKSGFKKKTNDKVNDNNEEEEVEESEESEDMKEDFKLTNILKQYFHEENGELTKDEVKESELETIEKNYKSLLSKNKSIEEIKKYQDNYIVLVINHQLKAIKDPSLTEQVQSRIWKIKNILNKIKEEMNK